MFFDVGASLDGFIAGPNGGPTNPGGDRGKQLAEWMFSQEPLRRVRTVDERATAFATRLVEATIDRTGALIMGKRTFEEWTPTWDEDVMLDATSVFVLTHERRSPCERSGTRIHFVDDGIESALARARSVARGRDVRIAGGADVIRQYLEAGLVDDFEVHLAPIVLGAGVRLFDGVHATRFSLELVSVRHSRQTAHLRYVAKKRVSHDRGSLRLAGAAARTRLLARSSARRRSATSRRSR